MQHDPVTLLHDIKAAGEFILERTRGATLAQYERDPLLSSAVERKFITIGEALGRLNRIVAEVALSLGQFPADHCIPKRDRSWLRYHRARHCLGRDPKRTRTPVDRGSRAAPAS